MEKNAGYEIRESVLFDNGRGFALGENDRASAPFVTWQFAEENGHRDYFWGHYHTEEAAAVKDFAARSADYQRRYGVQEVKLPIAEQMKAAKEQTEKPVDKVGSVRNGDKAAPPSHPPARYGVRGRTGSDTGAHGGGRYSEYGGLCAENGPQWLCAAR